MFFEVAQGVSNLIIIYLFEAIEEDIITERNVGWWCCKRFFGNEWLTGARGSGWGLAI
jgi:hypothetical protein